MHLFSKVLNIESEINNLSLKLFSIIKCHQEGSSDFIDNTFSKFENLLNLGVRIISLCRELFMYLLILENSLTEERVMYFKFFSLTIKLNFYVASIWVNFTDLTHNTKKLHI
jgi:hypothetical protein